MTSTNFRPTRVGGPLKATVEAPSVGGTKGHRVDQSGLRGHSVDDETYPWRVVGVGDAWEVHDVHSKSQGRHLGNNAVYNAHADARVLKLLYPAGYVEEGPLGPRNIGGPIETIAERLAGLRFFIWFADTGQVYRFQAKAVQDWPGDVLVVGQDCNVTNIGARWLAENQNVSLHLDPAPFTRGPRVELKP